MKIGILTQPLTTNYGGILQNYALQTILKQLGYNDVLTIDYGKYTWAEWFKDTIKITVKKILRRDAHYKSMPFLVAKAQIPLRRFVHDRISLTVPRIDWPTRRIFKRYKFDALIVGSDQVWRPCYNSHSIEDMYLQFAKDTHIKRLAYAASFGTDSWEYTEEQTLRCSTLAKKFDAISVREDSGVPLCRKYLGVDSDHLLDPTMLLNASDYAELCENVAKRGPFVFAYILDEDTSNLREIEAFANSKGLPLLVKSAGPNLNEEDSVELWLSYFRDASYVITDSFHGMVFSIIFNKDFAVLGNMHRGNSRFESLLRVLNLSSCLLECLQDFCFNIEWNNINSIISTKREMSIKWLQCYLGGIDL